MRAALVLGIAGLEVAAVIAEEHQDRVLVEAGLGERLADRADRLVHLGDAGVIVGQLAGPGAGQRPQVLGDERIGVPALVFLGRIEGVGIVLVMDFEIRERQQKRRFRAAERRNRCARSVMKSVRY